MLKFNFTRLLLISFCITLTAKDIHSQENTERKKIEAIINLSKFVDWSQNKSFLQNEKKLYILVDAKAFKNYELVIKNSSICHSWKIIYVDKPVDFEEGSVVFISHSMVQITDVIIRISTSKDILTISDNINDFCEKGGMININENKGQLKFEINYRNIQDKSLDISSKLLALSKIYE
jgi:hypothetical protein